MPTQTKTKAEEAQIPTESEAGWEDAPSSNLPPFCILQIGDTATGTMLARDIQVEERKVRGKIVKQERTYYRLKLTDESQGLNGGKKTGTKVTYPAGTVVTVPGAGALDRSMDLVALKLAGKDMDGEAEPSDYESLKGREFRITRKDDSVMKGGPNKGNPVKVYDVKHRAAK